MSKKAAALSAKKKLVSTVFPISSTFVDRINRIAAFAGYVTANGEVPLFMKRIDLYRHIAAYLGPAPIDYLEFGVHQGESIRQWSELNTAPESRFTGFDSFEGLPESWWSLDAGHFSTGGKAPLIDDDRVRFVKGWFQDTMDTFLKDYSPRHRLVINNDSDLYSSTLYTLTKLDHLLVPGTVIFFDEFDDVQHEFRAVEDYGSAYRKKFKVLAATDRFRCAALEVV